MLGRIAYRVLCLIFDGTAEGLRMRRLPRFCRWALGGLLLAGFVLLPAVLLWTGFAGHHLEAQLVGFLLLTVTVLGGGSALAKRLRERRKEH